MNYKLNIIEPWESGTKSAVNASIVKEKGDQFLLDVKNGILVRGKNAHYFICAFRNKPDKIAFNKHIKGVYPINMVFDPNISSKEDEIPDMSNYRANFLTGEIVI